MQSTGAAAAPPAGGGGAENDAADFVGLFLCSGEDSDDNEGAGRDEVEADDRRQRLGMEFEAVRGKASSILVARGQ